MDSDKSDEDSNAISKQILDYYRKYSQNKHLPKYFSGTSLSYMPPIVKEDEIVINAGPDIIIEDVNNVASIEKQTEEPVVESEAETEVKVPSPTSSIISTRKLEWDNGADIGYNNCDKKVKLHKSISLPILIGPVDNKNIDKTSSTKLSSQIVTVISYTTPEDNICYKQVDSTSSSSPLFQAEAPVESSSSSYRTDGKPISSSSSSYTNTMVYLKGKIGTPDAESTPKLGLELQKMYTETPFAPKVTKVENKVVNLCVTKPISIDCLDNKKKKVVDKKSQTSLQGVSSKCVQTGDSLTSTSDKCNLSRKTVPNQSIIVINYNEESDKKTCSSYTQSDADIASQCDSFEYYRNNNFKNELKGAKVEAASTDSSKEIPLLSQLITQKQSKSLVKDVDRSIELLQKLLKSKKYDIATKKRYIKKIVSKIVDNKYSEDSTTSSELFVPKNIVPQHPKQISKFTVKTFSDEFLPNEGQSKLKEDVISSPENIPQSSLDTGGGSSSLEKQQNESSGSYHSWKEDKTMSEKVLEQKRGQGDQIVKFAMKERQHQIAWINGEISHLTKLKGLLEKKTKNTTTVYMLSNGEQSGENSSSGSDVKRNYIIQTELSESTCSDVPVDYNLRDKSGERNYQVKELTRPEDAIVKKKVIGDIEVTSDDNTTNIRVKTRKIDPNMVQSQAYKLNGPEKYDTFPKSKAEEYRVWSHGRKELDTKPNKIGKVDSKYSSELLLKNRKPMSTTKCLCGGKCLKNNGKLFPEYTDDMSGSRNAKLNENAKTTYKPCFCKCRENGIDIWKASYLKKCFCNVQNEMNENKNADSSNENEKVPSAASSSSSKKDTESDKSIKCKCGCKCVVMTKRKIIPRTSGFEERREALETKLDDKENKSKRDTADMGLQTESKHNKEVQTSLYTNEDSTRSRSRPLQSSTQSMSSSTSSESMTSVSGSVKSCLCCKRKNVTAKHLYALRKKLSDQNPLCRPCYHQNKEGSYAASYFNNPGHVCNCYTFVQTKTLDEIKNTIDDLKEIDNEYCTCVNTDSRKSSDCCQYCKTKLKGTSKNRNGIAYMLTFENEILSVEKEKKNKRYLEEIKVKIPVSYKKHKDKENKRKKEKQATDSDETSTNEAKKKPAYSLQEFLCKNRPDFFKVAEDRRKAVNETKTQREEATVDKKMVFLKQYQQDRDKKEKRLFSAKEMKEITRRNYKKLPEVQQRLIDNKEKQLRQANRLIADTFNRKLRENVLKGKRNLPTDVNVINL